MTTPRKTTTTTCSTPTGKLKRIHVNQHAIRKNLKENRDEPVITVKHGKGNTYGHEIQILDTQGNVVARVVQPLDQKLACGARVWIETNYPVIALTRVADDAPLAKVL